jgi:uncharacterized protein (TIGR03435 family)
MTLAEPLRPHRLVIAAVLLTFVAPIALAQSSVNMMPCIPNSGSAQSSSIPTLTYDVASIRLIKSDDGSLSGQDEPHEAKLSLTGITMKNLISEAYGVSLFDVSGGPGWIKTDHYDVQAKSDDSVNAQLLKLNDCDAREAKDRMLRALLADRMKLTVHRATKEVTGYNLVLAKSGSRLKESKPVPSADDAANDESNEGSMSMSMGKNGNELTAQNYSMPSFAAWLNFGDLHSPVLDKTGLTGKYDIKLQWSKEDRPVSSSEQEAQWPSIFTAVQEQLGLKLQPIKTSVDTIVIDHVERPSPN